MEEVYLTCGGAISGVRIDDQRGICELRRVRVGPSARSNPRLAAAAAGVGVASATMCNAAAAESDADVLAIHARQHRQQVADQNALLR